MAGAPCPEEIMRNVAELLHMDKVTVSVQFCFSLRFNCSYELRIRQFKAQFKGLM